MRTRQDGAVGVDMQPVQMVKFGCELHAWYGRDDGLAGLVVVSLRRTSRKRNGDESGADEPHDWGRSRTTTIGHLGVSSCIRRDGNISGRLVLHLLRCIVDEGVGWLRIHPLQWSSAREMLAVEAPDLIRRGGTIGLVPRTGRQADGASRHWWRNRRWAGRLNTGRVQRYCLALVAEMIESSSRVVTYPEILQLAKRPYRRAVAQRAFVWCHCCTTP